MASRVSDRNSCSFGIKSSSYDFVAAVVVVSFANLFAKFGFIL